MIRSLCCFLILTAVVSAADGDAQPILDLYKSGKLFDKSASKDVRAAAAKVFEARHAEDLKAAFDADQSALSAWLDKHKDIKEELFTAINDQKDDVRQALKVFRDLWKLDAAAVAKYPNLAIAISVVWDRPEQGVYDYRHHQVRTKSNLPENYLDFSAIDEFKFHTANAKALQSKETANRYEVLPWEFQAWIVNHRTPISERDWAIKNYLGKRRGIGKIYEEIEYDKLMLKTQSAECKLNGHDYTLPDIRKYGGVCAMQADFAARVGKSLAVPASYVRGQSQDLEHHAWVMWVEIASANKSDVKFTLESHGRYFGDNYYTGEVTDPQSGTKILDRDMERRLSAAAHDRIGKRQADLVMGFYDDVAKAANLDTKKRVQCCLSTLRLSIFNEEAWLEMARMARDGEVKGDEVNSILDQTKFLLSSFDKYPDFPWRVAGDLLTLQKDAAIRNRFFEQMTAIFERRERPDLACEARLKWAEGMAESKKWSAAAQGLRQTIMKFPNEGRYVPKLLDRLRECCGEFPNGKDYVAKSYHELVMRINPLRGNEVTKYFKKISADALTYLRDEKKKKEADEVERKRRSVGLTDAG